MVTDTLTIAEELQAPGDGAFGAAQARRLAHALAAISDDKRLKDVEVRVGVLTWIVGLQLAVTLGVLWVVVSIAAQVAGVDERVTNVEDRVTSVERRLTAVEERVEAVERRLTAIEGQLGGMDAKLDRLLALPGR